MVLVLQVRTVNGAQLRPGWLTVLRIFQPVAAGLPTATYASIASGALGLVLVLPSERSAQSVTSAAVRVPSTTSHGSGLPLTLPAAPNIPATSTTKLALSPPQRRRARLRSQRAQSAVGVGVVRQRGAGREQREAGGSESGSDARADAFSFSGLFEG